MIKERQDTIEDIVAEMLRDCHQMHLNGTRCLDGDWVYTKGSVERLAVRIEVVYKREVDELRRLLKVAKDAISSRERAPTSEKSSQVGNASKMREALINAYNAMFKFIKTPYAECDEMAFALDGAIDALSAPPRNCDVGTPEDQHNRFMRFCDSKSMGYCWGRGCRKCMAQWGQLPYEEGGAK